MIIQRLELDDEFQKLLEHQLVKDSFDQLKTTVKLHQGLDNQP